jgi:iron(II)-dependent oxidoreductase
MTELVSTQYLADLLEDANSRTLELVEGLDVEQIMGPQLPIVNPLLWEIGHVAWFYEQFILRMLYGQDKAHENSDDIYDSIAIEHFVRWDLPLLPLKDSLQYINDVRSRLIDRLGEISDNTLADEQDSFIYPFATFHEDMHTEAYTYTRINRFSTSIGMKPALFAIGPSAACQVRSNGRLRRPQNRSMAAKNFPRPNGLILGGTTRTH